MTIKPQPSISVPTSVWHAVKQYALEAMRPSLHRADQRLGQLDKTALGRRQLGILASHDSDAQALQLRHSINAIGGVE